MIRKEKLYVCKEKYENNFKKQLSLGEFFSKQTFW